VRRRHRLRRGAGTGYAGALTALDEVGPANATDGQNMAGFCESIMPLMVGGGFSSRLVWEGAQKAGLTTLQLHEICHRNDLRAIDDLQWS
jgi:hypothetical protein